MSKIPADGDATKVRTKIFFEETIGIGIHGNGCVCPETERKTQEINHEEKNCFTFNRVAIDVVSGSTAAVHAQEDVVQPIVFQAAGPTVESIQSTVDAYRAFLGDPNNGNAPGPLPTVAAK